MDKETNRRLHHLVDVALAAARAELKTDDALMKTTMRIVREVARQKVREIERNARKRTSREN